MSSNIIELKIPKENANDEEARLLTIYSKNGEYVRANDIIGVFETCKVAFEYSSASEGYIFWLYNENDNIKTGEPFSILHTEPYLPSEYKNFICTKNKQVTAASAKQQTEEMKNISKSALELINKHKLDINIFSNMGLIRKKNVLEYLKKN